VTALLTIVADDLTGGCDSGTLFAGRGPVPLAIWPRALPAGLVRVIDTESRALDRREAADRVRAVAGAAPARHLFKKIDSTLRGRIGAETEAMMAARDVTTALLCPAFPAQGRVVAGRVLAVHGTSVSATAVAADPEFPSLPSSRTRRGVPDITELLGPQFERPLAWLPLDCVREGPGPLADRLAQLEGSVVLADSETDADLDILAAAGLASKLSPLFVGSAGLAGALARRLDLYAERVALPAGRRWLIVSGSRHPATRRQVEAARAAGLAVLAAPEADRGDRAAVGKMLAAEVRAVLERDGADLVVVTGGETAVALVEALGAERIDLVGAPRPGLALGYLRASGRPALPLITKAGGFGGEDLFVSLAREAAA